MKQLYFSKSLYKEKSDIVPKDIILQKYNVNGTRDILSAVSKGYSVFPGLFDYKAGTVIEDSKHRRVQIENENEIPSRLKLMDHVVGSWFVMLDIDDCAIPALDCINLLTIKPTGAYYTFSGFPGKEKFRLIYEFSDCLTREQYKGACEFLSTLFEQDTNVELDQVSRCICQLFHGTSNAKKIFWYNQDNVYSWQELGATEIKVQNMRLDVRNLIKTYWDEGSKFLRLLDNPKTSHVSVISRTHFGKLLQPVFRSECRNWEPYGTIVDGVPIMGFYQLIDKDTYLTIRFPRKRSTDKLRPGEGRKRYLKTCALQIRAIKLDITPWDLLYSLMILREYRTYWDYRGVDRIGINDLCEMVSYALLKTPEQIDALTRAWRKRCLEENYSKEYPFIVAKWGDVNNKRQSLSKEQVKRIRTEISALFKRQATNDKIREYYESHPLETPISIAASDIGISRVTLNNRFKDNDVTVNRDRKKHKHHSSEQQQNFDSFYDPQKSDKENKKALVESGLMCTNTYYQLKRKLRQ